MREELGQSPSEIFASIDENPLASASVAQVHRCTLKDGREAVVKVYTRVPAHEPPRLLAVLRPTSGTWH